MKTEGVELEFTDNSLEEIATIAYEINQKVENIGARRLSTIVEKVLEEISFEAPSMRGARVVVNRSYVKDRLQKVLKHEDLTKYIL